jgi:NitT/TauT family transport system substrate-binding protein
MIRRCIIDAIMRSTQTIALEEGIMRRRTTLLGHRQWVIIALFMLATIALAACDASRPAATPAEPPTSVSVQLGWVHEYSSAGFYAAEKNGHFAEQNLAVRLAPGGFGPQGYIDAVAQVTSGATDFGVASATNLIQARAAGQPVVGIASLFQRSPAAIIALESTGILRPQDLVGRRVAVADSALGPYTLLLKSQHIDPASVKTVPRTSFGIDPLVNGEVDAMYAWVINEGVQLREADHLPTMVLLSDYGVETYDLVLFTTERMIADHPDVVTRLLRASLEGWQDAIANPAQATQLTLTYDDKLNLDAQRRRLEATLPLLKPAGSHLGAMEAAVWQTTQQVLLDQNILTQPIDLERVYTQTFLNAVATN